MSFLVENRSQVLDVLTEVCTYEAATYEVAAAVDTLAGAADEVAGNRPRRLGSAAVFLPSNMLLYSYVLYLLVPSLFVDELSFRPARAVKEQAVRLHRLLEPAHGVPIMVRPVSQRDFVTRDVGAADLVVFTGRYANCEQVRSQLRPEQLMLFFGMGVNPFIVTANADLPPTIADLMSIRLFNTGQDCLAPDAIFVDRAVADRFVPTLVEELATRRFGSYRDPAADYGPLYYDSAFEEMTSYVLQHRQDVVHGGTFDFAALRADPTVVVHGLDGVKKFPEFFAPLFNVVVYGGAHELLRALSSNQLSERALGASVYGNCGTVTRHLEKKHVVTRNETLFATDDGNKPFGGHGRMANYASCRGELVAEPILVSKAVADYIGHGT